ncbi:hypothetical protein AV530_002420 [Patagioenas fasciata monilis]|nr:hypothetical protein AV530_002420 [Patagioenas fasciata monilis]
MGNQETRKSAGRNLEVEKHLDSGACGCPRTLKIPSAAADHFSQGQSTDTAALYRAILSRKDTVSWKSSAALSALGALSLGSPLASLREPTLKN